MFTLQPLVGRKQKCHSNDIIQNVLMPFRLASKSHLKFVKPMALVTTLWQTPSVLQTLPGLLWLKLYRKLLDWLLGSTSYILLHLM
jgi:hypothetical protein